METIMRVLCALAIIAGFTSMAAATSLETDKIEAGARFDEQKIETKMNSGNEAPVRMNIGLTEVKEVQCNAEAKDFSRLAAKKPSALVNEGDGEKKDDKTKKKDGISKGSIACGVLLGVAILATAIVSGSVLAGTIVGMGILIVYALTA
ncbi:MAG: hypothetical protein L6420_12115 [Elusimicrobia bacterium]|nr:hypothetical protein [Elusimicrobiota bacterium]